MIRRSLSGCAPGAWRQPGGGKTHFRRLPRQDAEADRGRPPANLEELDAIKGIGPAKLEQYGQSVLAIVSGQEGITDSQETAGS